MFVNGFRRGRKRTYFSCMTKRITILLAIMLCCLLGLLVMQGYLTYQEFGRQRADFSTQVNALFEQSVEVEKAARIERLVDQFMTDLANPEIVRVEARADREMSRTVFFFFDGESDAQEMSIRFDQIDLVADTMTAEVRRLFYAQIEEKVRKDFYEESFIYWTDRLAERIRHNFREFPVDTMTLRDAFQTRLDSVGIGSSFSLVIDTAFTNGLGAGWGRVIRTEPVPLFAQYWIGEKQAVAIIDNPGYVIFQRSLFTIGGSAAVVLLTLLSFYLLFATILRQKKLSELKDDFIDNVTHELQTPVAALRLAVDGLQNFEVIEKKERFARYLQVSAAELNRLSELVDGILLQSMSQDPKELPRESLDLMDLLREAADRHRLKATKPVSIQLPDRNTFEVFSSRYHLVTIIDNLLQNSIRYSKDEGVHIDIRLESAGQGFVLEVADDGWGISPEDRRHIFEKFHRSSDKDRNYTVKGLGIGLYHVRQCVDALGGSIRVRDNQPRGTVMEVSIEG